MFRSHHARIVSLSLFAAIVLGSAPGLSLADFGGSSGSVGELYSLQAPGNFRVVARNCDGIRFAWNDTSVNETGFRIYASLSWLNDWRLVATTSAGATSAYVMSTGKGNDTKYRVRAFKLNAGSVANGPYSNQIIALDGCPH